jgi:hypothetical protein
MAQTKTRNIMFYTEQELYAGNRNGQPLDPALYQLSMDAVYGNNKPKPPAPPPAPVKTKKDKPRIKLKKSRRESLGIGRRSRSQTRVPLNTGSSSTRGGINL